MSLSLAQLWTYLSPDIVHKTVMVALYCCLLNGDSVLAAPEAAEGVQEAGLLLCTCNAKTMTSNSIRINWSNIILNYHVMQRQPLPQRLPSIPVCTLRYNEGYINVITAFIAGVSSPCFSREELFCRNVRCNTSVHHTNFPQST